MSRFRTEWQFLAALALAAAFSDVASKAGRKRILRAVTVWARIAGRLGRAKVSPEIYQARLKHCEGCPIFYKPLYTCGSPLDRENNDLGCWCALRVKAKFKDSTCWLDDSLGEDAPWGWHTHGL